jgi:hypothetical protein
VKALTSLILVVCFASIALADDFKTIYGKEYKNVTVSRVEPDGIVITFSGGIVKIPFTELPPEIQKKYGYDPTTAADFQKQSYEAGLARAREIAEATERRQQYLASMPAPQPTAAPERQSSSATMHDGALDRRSGPQVLIYGTVLNVVDEGLLISVRETNAFGTERIPGGATVLLIGNFPGFCEEDKIQASGTLVGAYQYTTVMRSKRTAGALAGASVTKLTEFPPHVR